MRFWLLIFFLTPLIEIYVLISVGGLLGVWPTVIMVMLTAVIGVSLLRQQGLSTLTRGMQKAQMGELPAHEMVEGMLLAIAGALLLTPGFVTDAVGFVLLTPPLRLALVKRIEQKVQVSAFTEGSFSTEDQVQPSQHQTIEGEFERRP